MTQAKTQTPSLLFGNDEESIEANRRYQEALQRLTESLDTRKNRLFDPQLMAITRGFLEPGAPDFFESLGRVAKNLGETQTAQEKENREIAQMQLDVAGRGLEMQRQKSLQALAARQRQQAGAPPGAPQGGQRGFQIAPPDPNRITGDQYYDLAIARGIPPDEAMKTAAQIDEKNRQVREGGVFDARSGYFYPNKYETVDYQIFGKTYKIPQGAALELDFLAGSGDEPKFMAAARRAIRDFQRPPAAQGPVAQTPAAQGPAAQTPPPPAQTSAAPSALSQAAPSALPQAAPALPASAPSVVAPPRAAEAQQAGPAQAAPAGGPIDAADVKRRIQELARQHLAEPGARPDQVPPAAAQQATQAAAPREAAAPAARPPAALPAAPQVAQAAPAAVQPAAPAAASPVAARAVTPGLRSLEEIAAEKRQSEIQQAADTKRAEELAKAAAAKEAAVEQSDRTARNTYQSSSKILDYLKKSPNFFGIFARPGVVPAIGGFIEQGLRTGNGTIDLPGFRDSITKLMPNVRQQDLDNLMLAASELAEIELNFSRQYFQGQGPVTDSERKIVRAVPGSVSSSPRVLKARMELLRDRAQYDIDVADAFRDWQGKNVGRSYLDFERDSQLYKDIKSDFEKKAAKIYNGLPAIPTRERRAADQQGAVQQQSSQSSGVQPSVGFIRDPNTGVIRRKKPGE